MIIYTDFKANGQYNYSNPLLESIIVRYSLHFCWSCSSSDWSYSICVVSEPTVPVSHDFPGHPFARLQAYAQVWLSIHPYYQSMLITHLLYVFQFLFNLRCKRDHCCVTFQRFSIPFAECFDGSAWNFEFDIAYQIYTSGVLWIQMSIHYKNDL